MIMQDDIIDAIIITGTRVTWPMVTRVWSESLYS